MLRLEELIGRPFRGADRAHRRDHIAASVTAALGSRVRASSSLLTAWQRNLPIGRVLGCLKYFVDLFWIIYGAELRGCHVQLLES